MKSRQGRDGKPKRKIQSPPREQEQEQMWKL